MSLSNTEQPIRITEHDLPVSKSYFQFCGWYVFMQTPNNCLAPIVFSPFSARRGIHHGRVGMFSPLSWANIQVSSSQVVMIEHPKNVIRPWLSPMVSQWHNWQSYYFREMSLANSRRDIGVAIIMSYFIQLRIFPRLNLPSRDWNVVDNKGRDNTHAGYSVISQTWNQNRALIQSRIRINLNFILCKLVITFWIPFLSIK